MASDESGMSFCESISYETGDDPHAWALVRYTFRLHDTHDPFLKTVIAMVRRAYDIGDAMPSEPAIEDTFSLENIGLILAGAPLADYLSGSLPDPDAQAGVPPSLRVYRSESCEIVAQLALWEAHRIECPISPHRTKTNPDVPVHGFDGWGFLRTDDGQLVFVAIQVKGTDEKRSPPSEARKLARECKDAPRAFGILRSAARIMRRELRNTEYYGTIVRMLREIQEEEVSSIVVAPVVVRGTMTASAEDLRPVRNIRTECAPAILRGVVVSLGVDLEEFGRVVMTRARNAA